MEQGKTHTEYAVGVIIFLGEGYDRVDTGDGWSHRSGRKWTREEAVAEVERYNRFARARAGETAVGAVLLTREVTEWQEVAL